MKTFKYTCPYCGQEGEFGNHFCSGSPDNLPEKAPKKAFYWNPRASATVALVLAVVFLWSFLGPRALLIAAFIPLFFLIRRLVKTSHREEGIRGYAELLLMTGQDRALAERLIKAEEKNKPGIDRTEAVASALERLKYERSR